MKNVETLSKQQSIHLNIPSFKQCNSCKHYESYRDSYFGDELEPDNEGFCKRNPNKDYHTFGENNACKYYSK